MSRGTVGPATQSVPPRTRHAEGGGAFGHFETTGDVSAFTRANLFQPGVGSAVLVRFSRTLGFANGPDSWRDVRGFAVKFFTAGGEYDLVANNSPVFFLKDHTKFASLVNAQHLRSSDSLANLYNWDRLWAFFVRNPETTHQVTWLFGDRGIPLSWRHLDGFGGHAFAWENESGERFWVKYHLKTEQGIAWLTDSDAAGIRGSELNYFAHDLSTSIESGEYPAWSLYVQIVPQAAADFGFDPFDITKVWPKSDYPLIPVGRLVLDRNPDDEVAQIEQSTFSPSNFVPGIGPSPDPLLRARLVGYPTFSDHRVQEEYRSGQRALRIGDWPEHIGTWPDDHSSQAGTLVRDVLDQSARIRLAATIALHIEPIQDPELRARVFEYWAAVDVDLASAVERNVAT